MSVIYFLFLLRNNMINMNPRKTLNNDTPPEFDCFSQNGDITYSILSNKSYQNIFLVDTQNNEQSDTEQSIHILYILFSS